MVVERPYCSDLVYRSPEGSVHENLETGSLEILVRDGVSVSCFDKAGATYVYEGGALRRIIDADSLPEQPNAKAGRPLPAEAV